MWNHPADRNKTEHDQPDAFNLDDEFVYRGKSLFPGTMSISSSKSWAQRDDMNNPFFLFYAVMSVWFNPGE